MKIPILVLSSIILFASGANSQIDFDTTKPIGQGKEWTQDMAFGDLDGDGDCDLVTAEWDVPEGEAVQQGEVPAMIYINDGKGNFAFKSNLPPNTGFNSITMADMDNDGYLDIVTLMKSREDRDRTGLSVLFNDGKCNFAEQFTYSFSSSRLVDVGDFNNDGLQDILIGRNQMYGSSEISDTLSNFVLLNQGGRQFSQPIDLEQSATWIQSMRIGDLDNDGDLDVVFGYDAFYSELPPDFDVSQLGLHNDIFLNDGKGSFSYSQSFGSPLHETWALALGDIDRDGDLDIIEGNTGIGGDPQPNFIYRNDGKGNFDPGTKLSDREKKTCSLAVGDIDGDGDLDIVEGNIRLDSYQMIAGTGQDYIYLNDGKGNFDTVAPFGNGLDYTNVVCLPDVNNDGMPDIAAGNGDPDDPFNPEQSLIYLNNTKKTNADWKIYSE